MPQDSESTTVLAALPRLFRGTCGEQSSAGPAQEGLTGPGVSYVDGQAVTAPSRKRRPNPVPRTGAAGLVRLDTLYQFFRPPKSFQRCPPPPRGEHRLQTVGPLAGCTDSTFGPITTPPLAAFRYQSQRRLSDKRRRGPQPALAAGSSGPDLGVVKKPSSLAQVIPGPTIALRCCGRPGFGVPRSRAVSGFAKLGPSYVSECSGGVMRFIPSVAPRPRTWDFRDELRAPYRRPVPSNVLRVPRSSTTAWADRPRKAANVDTRPGFTFRSHPDEAARRLPDSPTPLVETSTAQAFRGTDINVRLTRSTEFA